VTEPLEHRIARKVDKQAEQQRQARNRPAGTESTITDTEAAAITAMLCRILTRAQRDRAAAQLSQPG
jgi:hypothetical protein